MINESSLLTAPLTLWASAQHQAWSTAQPLYASNYKTRICSLKRYIPFQRLYVSTSNRTVDADQKIFFIQEFFLLL